MELENASQSQPPALPDSGENLSFMDKQFRNMSGCGQWGIVILFPFIGLIVGLMGLLACKDAKARSRASTMALVGGIWFAISMVALTAMLNSAPK